MAESSRVGSYRCEFIDDVPEHLVCGVCKHAANGPSITMCCGELFCKACIASALEEKRPCPSCKEPTFSTFLNPKFEKSIKNLRVHCTMKDRGCQWIGQLEQLDTHLDVETGDCEHVDIECPEKCGQQIQKRQLAAHIANECPERDFVCQYCGFKATYVIISNKHWPECQNYPVPCPNECSIGAVERNILEDHLNTCPLQVVECDFSYAGCNKKLQRQDMEKHVQESTQEHLTLMAAASVRMSWEFEKKLQEQRDEFQGYLKQKEKEVAEQKDKIKAVEEQLVRQNDHFQESLQETQTALQVANEKLRQFEAEQRENVDKTLGKSQMLEAQIVDLRNQMERRDRDNQRKLQKEEEQIKVLAEQLQQKNKEIQNLQQADERLRENLQQNERQSKEMREQLQVKHEQTKQQMTAVEKQLKTQSKEFQEKLKESEQQTQQVNQKLEKELQRKQDEFKTKQDRQIKAVDTKMTDIGRQIQKKTTQIEKRVHDCENYNFPPIILTRFKPSTEATTDVKPELPIWEQMMLQTKAIQALPRSSQYMYTHSGGYMFRLRVYENGRGGTHMSVELVPYKGPFDDSLRWPAMCTITLQLLNQYQDQDHHTVTKELVWRKPTDRIRTSVTFSDTFIALNDLKWNAEKHTQYLKDDCLHFRISRVDLKLM